jgi:hypothetical protein
MHHEARRKKVGSFRGRRERSEKKKKTIQKERAWVGGSNENDDQNSSKVWLEMVVSYKREEQEKRR